MRDRETRRYREARTLVEGWRAWAALKAAVLAPLIRFLDWMDRGLW